MICVNFTYWLHIPNYIYETKSRPSLLFLIIHKVLSSNNIFIKLAFILKNPGTCIDCIFRKQSMFIKNDSILISISKKHRISLLSVLAHKLVTPLSTINTTSALPSVGQLKLSDRLNRCAPSKTMYCHRAVHYQRIISNAVLLLSHSPF